MARADNAPLPLLSVLDRLIDTNPERAQDAPPMLGQRLTELRNAARRDLEMLLNTRQRCLPWPDSSGALNESILNYGIPDFTAENLATKQSRERFRRAIEIAIRTFEKRFVKVSVMLVEDREQIDRTMRFRIEALMLCDPEPEPVVFDTILDPASRSFAVRARGAVA